MAMAAQAIPHPYPFVSYQPPNAYNFRVSVPSIFLTGVEWMTNGNDVMSITNTFLPTKGVTV